MKTYHGTTRESANNILSGKGKEGYTWSCSDDEFLYLWCPDRFIEQGECDDMDDAEQRAISMAFESAQITAATSELPQSELIVLCFDFNKDDLQDDLSCQNMDLAQMIELDSYSEYLVKTLKCSHNSRLDALVITGLLDNENFPTYKLDDDLIKAAEQLKDVWLDSLLEFDWEEITV